MIEKNMPTIKPRLLTGDTPTGKLHLGHWVGSLENRIQLQDDYDCYFLIANPHAFSTKAEKPQEIHDSVLDIALDYLAAGIDPKKSCVFLESSIPAIFELATYFSMIISYPRLMRNPTIKDEIRDKQLGDHYSMGFLWYPILQVADILAFRADVVPVGEDQAAHLELTRETARKFNQLYCGVDAEAGGLFPIPAILLGRTKKLIGLGAPTADGNLLKMSKSLNNSILLSDDADTVRQKIMTMYTDPKRMRATDPGTVENNPLWIFHTIFNADKKWVEEAKQKYRHGQIGDVECKKKLIECIVALLEPMHKHRKELSGSKDFVLHVIREGAEKANEVANKTLCETKEFLRQIF
ncbi:MAG: tryptophan--tRNA ligase [Gammaproteobacteria bacterium RIFCSPHIGHO2_02_FULL_39_13]|nr:MAG: tryptophan--tRNA ligase [Gammaproteobacteria bacterium RIFCSPHIGHO2_02_FULL_39_13]OGT48319.1 MAG: tryptophan--tRNA ligase [Gammaproteobacteria bacterium RIFCSPHIGHO2_12_FULL_39_24]